MAKKILIGLAVLLLLLIGVGFLLPTTVTLERDVVVDAPPATVYTVVSNFGRFNEWSPWAELDPDAKYDYEGPAQGVGSKMSWESDDRSVGVGSQEIVAADPWERIDVDMWFDGQGNSKAYYLFEPVDDGTRVTWGFVGDFSESFVGRYFGPMIEGMLGPQYEEGLANLKALAEGLPDADFADLDVTVVEAEPVTMAYIEGTSTMDEAAVGGALAEAYGKIVAFLGSHELAMASQPLAVNKTWENDTYEFSAGIPVEGEAAAALQAELGADSEVQIGQTYGGKIAKVVHVGPYGGLEKTYQQIEAWMAANAYEAAGDPWDVWISDPSQTPEEQLVTHVHYPIDRSL